MLVKSISGLSERISLPLRTSSPPDWRNLKEINRPAIESANDSAQSAAVALWAAMSGTTQRRFAGIPIMDGISRYRSHYVALLMWLDVGGISHFIIYLSPPDPDGTQYSITGSFGRPAHWTR
jgi:hypothetical protein